MNITSEDNYATIWQENLFKGKVCLITGGSGDICKEQAKALIRLGCSISIVGRNAKKVKLAVQELGEYKEVDNKANVIGFGNCDVRNFEKIRSAVRDTSERLGKIDFLVCGAAGNFMADFNHLSVNAFKAVIDIDLIGTFNTVKACFEDLKSTKGSIIFISATLHYYGVPFQSHVSAAKSGIDALARSLAVEFGPLGIRGFNRIVQDKKQFSRKIPIQRVGKKSDIANATIFLFSKASSFITGTILVVDGGFWQMGNINTINSYPEMILAKLKSKI
ncbi:hypothetical protein HII12_003452 [Brettanomyces bruxellensis]|uniref:2,4-dienoyl-CoA reductase [(3E)-enoyl-CoA-producing] n=1 Tax=Dekkera bruxellensis TaxID=5007 RepID=A0A8H6ETN0_DEKBR|nr:hypothetical protein HII12_003452 [Brettanomyces bruxellensis]